MAMFHNKKFLNAMLHAVNGDIDINIEYSETIDFFLASPSFQRSHIPLRCAVEGALLPRPTAVSSHPAFKCASENLKGYFDAALAGKITAGFDTKNTSFAISLVSLQPGWPRPNKPIWTYTHLSPNNVKGTKKVAGDSQWLVGSVSKMFTDIVLLKSGVNVRDKITKYLPALNSTESLIDWNEITLEDLGDHLAGIPPNYGFPEVYQLIPLFQQLGLPPVEDSDFPPCNVEGLNRACIQQQFLEGMVKVNPATAVGERAVYSNLAFILISFALHNATGKNYTELLDELVIKPLNLNNTWESPGDNEKAVIPPVDNGWGLNYTLSVPAGGLYSSLNDLSAVALSILQKTLLPPSLVRKWLKSTSTTPNLSYSVGLPWEIYRTTNLTPEYPHTIDIYAKDGGAYGYVTRFGLIEQYGVGFIVLTAGDTEALYPIVEAAVSGLIAAVEEATRTEALKYTGVFSNGDNGAPVVANFSIDHGPGLKLNLLQRNGSDILEAIGIIWSSQPVSLGNLSPDFRLYPAEISRNEGLGQGAVVKEDWRLALEVTVPTGYDKGSQLPNNGAFTKPCPGWQTYDLLYYGGQPIDRVVFWLNVTTREVIGLEVPFLKSGVMKLDTEDQQAIVAKMQRANR
ncbi:hypothetical protein H072_6481 [Dactylellina haptotyla CBS 200.50]|uniref:Uncharacterized protein n=1 Tax=Dactylellina haptotyla (strain CBS 200.50) TaxID=1284197 RepID=S8AA03_DACHA|nr:hypothetical protein H072_6481 [Dactylellina haptotyla CBS 200.50]